ncbi:hypothetical protein DFP74_1812 [Nocardiopsis sp. Huas11]|uniref:pilin n=1 Tax=Nocardiopsis sp. Huas11 TaxID=2183912 RepID=UPI000F12CE12|nr:pilin [Nocardiopsis sp. Huas11]RKS06188.1 hypothetical protein DFP74_1812 [Nocardiopsis sp. Huas11]
MWEQVELASGAELALAAGRQEFNNSGNEILGYVAGLGVVLGILALVVVGGRMIHANFTGDPWIAARGMADLPYVVLAIVLIVASGTLVGSLLQGSTHETEENLGSLIEGVAQDQDEEEREAADCEDGVALETEDDNYICPDKDGYEELDHATALSGPDDPRCTDDGSANCWEYCYEGSFGYFSNGFKASPCTPDDLDLMEPANWSYAPYHCPNLPASWWERSNACRDHPLENAGELPDEYGTDLDTARMQKYYACVLYGDWVLGNQNKEWAKDSLGQFRIPDHFCPVTASARPDDE